jgi:hypothetical protein
MFSCGRSCRRWHLGPGVDWDVPLGPGHLRRCNGRRRGDSGVEAVRLKPPRQVRHFWSEMVEQGPDRQRAPGWCSGGVSSIDGASVSRCIHDGPGPRRQQQLRRDRHPSSPEATAVHEAASRPFRARAATRAGEPAPHGCHHRGGSGGSGRSGTSAPWPVRADAAHGKTGHGPGGRHRRTSRGGCGHSCRAGAHRPAGPAAPGRGWEQRRRRAKGLGLWAQPSGSTFPSGAPASVGRGQTNRRADLALG